MLPFKPTPRSKGVRYVDVRLAIPDGSPLPSSNDVVGYLQSLAGGSGMSNAPSPFFVPLGIPSDESNDGDHGLNSPAKAPFCPPSSPFDYRKTTASPALTATTVDSECSYINSRGGSGGIIDTRLTSLSPSSASRQGFVSPLGTPTTIFEDEDYCQPVDSFSKPSQGTTWSNIVAGPTPTKCPDLNAKPRAKLPASSQNARIKTELCMHHERGGNCPFGDNCTFAHGEEELNARGLAALCNAGLADAATFRTKPCLAQISTGCCPFGKRCVNIHDKRVDGSTSYKAWLPHTETQGNTINTDINVESKAQKHQYSIFHDNPFGSHLSLANDDWTALYNLVCNLTQNQGRRCLMLPVHKIDIALQMLGPSDWSYKFRPQHVIHGQLCMVLQKRAFRIPARKGKVTAGVPGRVKEIPMSSYNPRSPCHVVVWELAFGPDSEPSVSRNVSLWFDIEDSAVATCTAQQAKRFRWKRGSTKSNKKEEAKVSAFDQLECFFMVRPNDCDAFDLVRQILQHQLAQLQAKYITGKEERFEVETALMSKKIQLKKRINAQIEHWKQWSWPINEGREYLDDDTPVPPVDGYYFEHASKMPAVNGAVKGVWESFVSCNFDGGQPQKMNGPCDLTKKKTKRLSTFESLAHGYAISPNRNLPHILGGIKEAKVTEPKKTSEKCWQSLLLFEQADGQANEWDIVREHFEKSRSKKVLSILQQ